MELEQVTYNELLEEADICIEEFTDELAKKDAKKEALEHDLDSGGKEIVLSLIDDYNADCVHFYNVDFLPILNSVIETPSVGERWEDMECLVKTAYYHDACPLLPSILYLA